MTPGRIQQLVGRATATHTQFSLLFLALALVVLGGCQYDPWANDFLTAQPSEKDLVGTYTVDHDSQQRKIRLQPSKQTLRIDNTSRIVLLDSHTAQFLRVPEESPDLKGLPCSVTGKGSWKLVKNDKFYTIQAYVANEEPNTPCKDAFGYELMLYGKKPPYKLHITLGDPDSGDAVQFEKQN